MLITALGPRLGLFNSPNMENWFGYKHSSGNIIVKRCLNLQQYQDVVEDSKRSDLVIKVFSPFPAKNREDAIDYILKLDKENE